MEIIGKSGLRLGVILLFALFLARLLRAFTSRLVQISKAQSRAGQMREQQTRTMAGLLYSVGTTVIAIVAILMGLEVLNFDIAPALATAGLASVAIAFGAQSLLKDVINGFFIVFEDQYVVGDLIQVNSEIGRVEHLTLRRTVIRNPAGAMVTMPNSLVGQVANLSRDWSQAFVDVTVPADEMVGRALATLEKIAGDFRNDSDWTPAIVDGPRVLGVESLSRRHRNPPASPHDPESQGRRCARTPPPHQNGLRTIPHSAEPHAQSHAARRIAAARGNPVNSGNICGPAGRRPWEKSRMSRST